MAYVFIASSTLGIVSTFYLCFCFGFINYDYVRCLFSSPSVKGGRATVQGEGEVKHAQHHCYCVTGLRETLVVGTFLISVGIVFSRLLAVFPTRWTSVATSANWLA